MLRIRGLCICGVRTFWRTEADGDFYCPGCGGDRRYRRRVGTRKLTVLGIPLVSRGSGGTIVECAVCRTAYGLEALSVPTSSRLTVMLRDAVYTVALAVLVAGGYGSTQIRRMATETVNEVGFTGCTEEQLTAMLESLTSSADDLDDTVDGCGSWLSIELHESLEPLAEHLAPQGRERILLQGARIALADGPYTPAERETLAAVGRCLRMSETETEAVLEAATRRTA